MGVSWFRPRGYRHFDAAVGKPFAARVTDSTFVASHSWSPLISYVKREKRYKPSLRKTVLKPRPIMYASHRDACILSYYADRLTHLLDARYKATGLDQAVIAYRSLGKSNYDFTADALKFAQSHAPCVVLCFDVTGFFDNLDHKILKHALASLLGAKELPEDWFAVFKAVSRFKHVPRDSLKAHPDFALRLNHRSHKPIATIAEVKAGGITILENGNPFGIPQGTPISAALSNLYMGGLDVTMAVRSAELGALYQRYSDDILLICPLAAEADLTASLVSALTALKLQIKPEKTERAIFDPRSPEVFQYLGFNVSPDGAVIRPGSLARQWRKARRSIRKTRGIGELAIAEGGANKIFTKKLRRRFSAVGLRNFSSYARRSSAALGSKKILGQIRRLERMVDNAIKDM